MAYTDVRGTVVSGPLANVSVAYRNLSYIADRVFPILDNIPHRAQIARYLKGAWFRDEAGIRAPGSRAKRGGYPTDYITVAPEQYAFAKEVTEEDRKAATFANAAPMNPDQDAISFCADRIDLSKERRVANLVKTGTWSGVAGEDAEGGWAADAATNTFITDVEARIETIRGNTGMRPNVLVLSANTLAHVKQIAGVLDRIRYVERGIVSAPLLAAIFELQEVLIGDAIYSSAVETKAGTDFSAVNIWEKNAAKGSAFLFYRPTAPGLKVPSAGYQAREPFEGGMARKTTTWYEPAEHQDVYEVAEQTDIVQTGSDLGFFWYDTIAT